MVTGTATPADPTIGSTVVYTFTVENRGGRPSSASLDDLLPTTVAPVGAAADQGSCSGAQEIRCALGSIAPGQTVTVTIAVQVTSASEFQNTVSVAAGDPTAKLDVAGNGVRLIASAATPVRIALPQAKTRTRAKAKPSARRKAKATSKAKSKAAATAKRKHAKP